MQCCQIVSYYQEHIHDKHLDDDPDVVANLYSMHHLNPIQSDSLRKMYIRQTKNDSIDSFLIAEVIRFGQFSTTSMADWC